MIDVLLMFINKIKKLIGTTTDASGTSTTGTVMGKLNGLFNNYNTLNTSINTRAPSSTALSTSTWTSTRAGYLDYLANGTYGLNAIKTLLNTINTNTSSGTSVIKSVQRGTVYFQDSSSITVSTINSSKCAVLLNDSVSTSGEYNSGCYLYSVSSSSITIKCDLASRWVKCSWQVIEFN